MILRWLFAALHLLALGVGLGTVWARERALRGELDQAGLLRVFSADTAGHRRAVVDRNRPGARLRNQPGIHERS
jgi:hypothetical protein